ncbi:MAG TPA: N4-gp56 family major capsid protein [Candidatus Atribacteria bacterium]|nr:N4-gp56 family major capsid protein [Candidatus Atribacteria bacterium]
MAQTQFAKDSALAAKIWAAKLFKEALRNIFFSRFMGESADNIVQVKTDLTKTHGDKITFPLRMVMTGEGQSGQAGITLEGNEEALTFYDFSQELTEYGHSVRARSLIDLQRPAFDLRTEMKDALKEWIGEKTEKSLLTAAITSPTTNRRKDVTGESPGTLSVAYIQACKRMAQLATPKVRPVKIEGDEYYAMIVHPYASKALKADSDWKNAQMYANIRGKSNPLFTGALGVVDGVVLFEYDRSPLLYDTSNKYCYSVLLGAQALVVAWALRPTWNEKLFDYNTIPGVGTKMLAGFGKTVFNNEDFATITLMHKYVAD